MRINYYPAETLQLLGDKRFKLQLTSSWGVNYQRGRMDEKEDRMDGWHGNHHSRDRSSHFTSLASTAALLNIHV